MNVKTSKRGNKKETNPRKRPKRKKTHKKRNIYILALLAFLKEENKKLARPV